MAELRHEGKWLVANRRGERIAVPIGRVMMVAAGLRHFDSYTRILCWHLIRLGMSYWPEPPVSPTERTE